MAVSMDQLTASLDAHCDVAANPFDINRPHPRFSDYSNFREPATLMGDQNKRRAEFLERQKSKREALVNLQRRLLDQAGAEEENICASDSISESDILQMPSKSSCPSKWTLRNQLMLSEWLVDVPSDLEENWLVKPCPKGRRMMIVASQGNSKAYSKAGHVQATFSSALPGGNSSHRQGITILDCVWNWSNQTYYVLDVLAWNNIVLLDCESEFRFYWLKTKLEEYPEACCQSSKNRYTIEILPSVECKVENMNTFLSCFPMFSEEKDPGLDGLLFYHKSNLYEHGSTPLVTWLKPFMIEDVLGISIHPSYMAEKPAGYQDQAAYIKDFEQAALEKKAYFQGGRKGKAYQQKGRRGKRGKQASQDDSTMEFHEDEPSTKMDEEPPS